MRVISIKNMALIDAKRLPEAMKRKLTFKIKNFIDDKEVYIKGYETTPAGVLLPRALIPGHIQKIEDAQWERVKIPFNATLYDYQEELAKKWLEHGHGIIRAGMGAGKTVVSLYIAHKLGLKTLVIVHTEFLMRQWIERVKKFCGFTPTIIQGNTCMYYKPITVAMLHTLALGKRINKDALYNQFGLTIYDEVHRIPTKKFNIVAGMFWDKHRVGLSATPTRKDGAHGLIFAHIGNIVAEYYSPVRLPIIYFVEYFSPFSRDIYNHQGKFMLANFLNNISKDRKRLLLTLKIIKKFYNQKRRILVLADRLAPLKALANALKKLKIKPSFIIGGRKEPPTNVILAIYKCGGEGVDIDDLSVLIMLTPRAEVTQAIGRVMRARTHQPIVIDIIDMQSKEMRKWYAKKERKLIGISKEIKKVVIHYEDL